MAQIAQKRSLQSCVSRHVGLKRARFSLKTNFSKKERSLAVRAISFRNLGEVPLQLTCSVRSRHFRLCFFQVDFILKIDPVNSVYDEKLSQEINASTICAAIHFTEESLKVLNDSKENLKEIPVVDLLDSQF